MPRLAIVGTEGTGKTVLVAALAKYLSATSSCGIEAKDAATQRYVSSIWNGLSAQTWPASTEQPVELGWLLRTDGGRLIDLTWLDPPGREVRELFAKGYDPDSQSAAHDELAAKILSADIVLLLFNLADFVGEPDGERRDTRELAIRFFLNRLSAREDQPRVAIVMTQADLFSRVVEQLGVKGIIGKYLPSVARGVNALERCDYLAVSAIQRTDIKIDADGIARRFPGSIISSEGIDALGQWIIDRADAEAAEVAHLAIEVARNTETRLATDWTVVARQIAMAALHFVDQYPLPLPGMSDASIPFRRISLAAIVFTTLYMGCLFVPSSPKPQILSHKRSYEHVGLFDYDGIVTGQVRNDGATGFVTLQATWKTSSKTWTGYWSETIPSGKTVPFVIRFREYSTGEATYEVRPLPK